MFFEPYSLLTSSNVYGNQPKKYDDVEDDHDDNVEDGDDDDDEVLETLFKGMEPCIVFTVVAIFMPFCLYLDTQIPMVLYITCVQG
jgi:hypothetical protein